MLRDRRTKRTRVSAVNVAKSVLKHQCLALKSPFPSWSNLKHFHMGNMLDIKSIKSGHNVCFCFSKIHRLGNGEDKEGKEKKL